MGQLVDLEHVLNAAKEIGEGFQKELDASRAENEALQIKINTLVEENMKLNQENEQLRLEMNNLRSAKNELRIANEAFAGNLNQLATQLNENHARAIANINQLLNDGLQKFVIEYVNKMRGEVATVQNQDNNSTEIVVEDNDNLPDVQNEPKPRMQFAGFIAEEYVDKDNENKIELTAITTTNKH